MAENQSSGTGEKEYFPFLNGKDIVNYPDGVECDILAVRDRKDGKGFFVDVKADNGENYTISANEVMTSMLMKKLEGMHVTVFPYVKGDAVYLSTKKQDKRPQQQKSNYKSSAASSSGFKR